MYDEFIGKRLKSALKQAGLTQEGLAKILKTKHSVISRWISGGRNPKLATVKKIAKATGKDLSYFLSESGDVAINTGAHSAVGRNAQINSTDTIEIMKRYIKKLEEENAYLKGKIEILEKLNQRS